MDENKTQQNDQYIYCRKCGSSILSDSIFCSRCGAKVETNCINENIPDNNIEHISSNTAVKAHKSHKKAVFIRTLGIILSILFLSALVICWILGWAAAQDNSCYYAHFVLYEETWILWSLSIICAVILVIAFSKIAMYKKKFVLRLTSLLVIFVLLFYSISSVICINVIRKDIERIRKAEEESIKAEEEKNRLKYTEISIPSLNSEILRYPNKYNGTTIKLEGYAYGIDLDNNFYLCFPEATSKDLLALSEIGSSSSSTKDYGHDKLRRNHNFIFVSYEKSNDKNTPNILVGDYVVITGTIELYTFYSMYNPHFVDAKIVNATYEIKSLQTK